MSWLSAAPAVVLAAFWLLGPGLLVGFSWGMRGLVVWGAAPLLSVSIVSISAVAAPGIGAPWGPWVPLLAAVLLTLVALGVRAARDALFPKYRSRPEPVWAMLHRRVRTAYIRLRTPKGRFARLPTAVDELPTSAIAVWPNAARREGPDGRRAGIAALVGVGVAVLLGWITAVNGMGPADALSQTYDAVFHYSAVAHIVATGDASSLTLGTLTNPTMATAFYPGAWHDVVALVEMSTGVGVLASTNATALAVAAVAWPLGCLALARQVLGRSIGVALATPVLAVGFTAFPWALMSFGVLWPNLLGVALLPPALAAVATVCGLARDSALSRPGAWMLLVVALPTLGLSHPNTVFSLAILAAFPVLWGLVRLTRRNLLTRRFWLVPLAVAVVGGLVWLVVWLMVASPLLAGVRSFDWKAFETTGQSVWAVLTNSTNERPDAWTISVLVLVGIVFALRRASTSWLVPAHLASGFLYLQAASQEGGFTEGITGAWYNDSFRLAAMVPVTGAVLAVIGLTGIAGLVRVHLLHPVRPPWRKRLPALLVAVATLVAVLLSDAMDQNTHARALAGPYQLSSDVLLEPGQRAFLEQAAALIPPDAVVAENPYTGNSLLYPLTGREVLFPHLNGNWTEEQKTVAFRLRDAPFDPSVCAAVNATRTTYVLTGPVTFWSWSGGAGAYPGLDVPPGTPGFEVLVDDGHNQLLRVTACDQIPVQIPITQS